MADNKILSIIIEVFVLGDIDWFIGTKQYVTSHGRLLARIINSPIFTYLLLKL